MGLVTHRRTREAGRRTTGAAPSARAFATVAGRADRETQRDCSQSFVVAARMTAPNDT